MHATPRKLVTVVAEPVLEERLIADLKRLCATGYMVSGVRGEGTRGLRTDEVPGYSIRIEAVVSVELADRLLAHVAEAYFPSFAVIAYAQAVEVVRGDKYR